MDNIFPLSPEVIFLLILVLGIFIPGPIWRLRENRNSERIAPGFKLLRGPGESLRRQIADIDDKLFSWLSSFIWIPIILFIGFASAYIFSGKIAFSARIDRMLPFLLFVLLVFVIISTVKICRLLNKRRNLYLGYFGERVVSENLDQLRAKGAAVFHDVPLQGRAGSVNIDHVVVCPAGIFAIETKTRRQRRARDGRADGKITYDGAQLNYPWGADTFGLSQATTNALWLDKNIDKTGISAVTVQPILTFPGWRVEQTGDASASAVRVLNPAQIPPCLDTLPPVLNANQVKHIASQLEALCRDVEF